MNGAELPSMIGTSGVFSSTIALSMPALDERRQQVLHRLDARLSGRQLRGIGNRADVTDARRDFDAAQVSPTEANARIRRQRA